jgi:hypothetical protein
MSVTDNFYEQGKMEVWRNRGDGTFQDVTQQWAPHTATGWMARIALGDFNGDGWVDLFPRGRAEDQRLYINRGGTGFSAHVPPEAHLHYYVMDADGDGKSDLYWPAYTGPILQLAR